MARRVKNPISDAAWSSSKKSFEEAKAELLELPDGRAEYAAALDEVERAPGEFGISASALGKILAKEKAPPKVQTDIIAKLQRDVRARAGDIRVAIGIRRQQERAAAPKKKPAKKKPAKPADPEKAAKAAAKAEAKRKEREGVAKRALAAAQARLDDLVARRARGEAGLSKEIAAARKYLDKVIERAGRKMPKQLGRKKVLEGKTAGVRWWINRVPSAWDNAGLITEYKLEPRIEMARRPAKMTDLMHRRRGGGKIIPPEGMVEGEEVCLVWDPKDPDRCIKYGNIPIVFTDTELMMRKSPRKKKVEGVHELQKLHPLLTKQMVSRGISPDDFVPARSATLGKGGKRPYFMAPDEPEFVEYRRRRGLSGVTWEEQRAHDLGIKVQRLLNRAKLWYQEHGLKATARRTMAGRRKAERERMAAMHAGPAFRPVGERALLPTGVERGGRTPAELRRIREQRRQREAKQAKRERRMGAKKKAPRQTAAERREERRVAEAAERERKRREAERKREERYGEFGRLAEATEHERREAERKKKQRSLIAESRKALGLPPLENPPPKLTKKQREELLAKDFGLSKKRMYPVHTIQWARHSIQAAIQDFDKGKITKAECKRVVKKAEARIEKMIDDAVSVHVNPGSHVENPKSFLSRTKKDPSATAREQGRASAARYVKMRKSFEMSSRQGRPRWDYLMEAYDAIENARANFEIAGMGGDARSAQAQKKVLNELLLAYLEQGETGEVVVAYGPTTRRGWWQDIGLSSPPEDIDEAKAAYKAAVRKHHPDRGGDPKKFRRAQAGWACAQAYMEGIAKNPPSGAHQTNGLKFLKKAQTHWNKYYETCNKADLMAAYKHLILAEQEFKYAGDKENLADARKGIRAATAELKDRIEDD